MSAIRIALLVLLAITSLLLTLLILLHKGRGGQLCRSAAMASTIMGVEGDYALVKLPSGETMSRPARFGFWTLRSAVSQTVGASSFMPRWNGSSFICALNCFNAASSSVVGMVRTSSLQTWPPLLPTPVTRLNSGRTKWWNSALVPSLLP